MTLAIRTKLSVLELRYAQQSFKFGVTVSEPTFVSLSLLFFSHLTVLPVAATTSIMYTFIKTNAPSALQQIDNSDEWHLVAYDATHLLGASDMGITLAQDIARIAQKGLKPLLVVSIENEVKLSGEM
jgi:hypothetical protein